MNRKRLIFFIKLAISVGIIAAIYWKVVGRDGSAELGHRLANLAWGWVLAAACMQLAAIAASVARWNALLVGQGIHAPFRHLLGSFMIGRFFGAFTPGGFTGLNGYRLYDIAAQTGKTARSTACIGIEMVLGQLAFGAVVIGGSIFGLRFIGLTGVLLVDGFFVGLIAASVLLITRPTLFRLIANYLPRGIQARVQTSVDAVCAYQGKGWLVTKATLLGMTTHAFNNLIYVCAAQALGVELGIGEVFFASAMQIFSTLLPTSINGVGVREGTAVALYTRVGVPESVALLIPIVGFAVEMSISAFGGLVFMLRRVGYKVEIQVDDAEHEQMVNAEIEVVSQERWPKLVQGTVVGLGAGLIGGALLGMAEGAVILSSSSGDPDLGVLSYGGLAYALLCGVGGAGAGFALALSGRLMKRAAVPLAKAYAQMCALVFAGAGFAIGAFRVRRDYFHEELVWKSVSGLGVLVGCLLAAAVVYLALSLVIRLLVSSRGGRFLLTPWGSPAGLAGLLALTFGTGAALGPGKPAPMSPGATKAPQKAGNVLFIVVDTMRAEQLPAYGYEGGKTPNLEAFAKDAVRFEQAFANASWTRPSFASMLTGRYPSSHRTMSKAAALPDDIVTLAEAFKAGGYSTGAVVTNYNVAPFFNFHQGFDRFSYLEPEFVFGANDTAAKLLFIQFLRQKSAPFRARGHSSAYQPAPVVNGALIDFIEEKPPEPFFLFAGYMDPHDPYYSHPLDGTSYAREDHQHPDPADAPMLEQLYNGEITYWDAHFGKLLQELKDRGLYDDMTIVVTSDHGEEFMDHGGFWHGTTLYDEQVWVPLYVKWPANARGGQVVDHWVQSIDLMPSLLTRAGLEVPSGVQGQDLENPTLKAFAEENHEGNKLRALRTLKAGVPYKLIEANPGNPRKLEPVELFRMDFDPQEKDNLARGDQQTLVAVAGELDQKQRAAEEGRAAEATVDVTADANAMERLKALGYAGDD